MDQTAQSAESTQTKSPSNVELLKKDDQSHSFDGISFASVDEIKNPPVDAISKPIYKAEEITFKVSLETKIDRKLGTTKTEITSLLNKLHSQLQSPLKKSFILDHLYEQIENVRLSLNEKEWENCIKEVIDPHPIKSFLSKDPCTRRSMEKPRGYAGDAALLDFFYSDHFSLSNLELESEQLLKHTISRPAGTAVKERLRIIGKMIDATITNNPAPKILSIACGHYRELFFSNSVLSRNIKVVGFDQDPESTEHTKKIYSNLDIEIKPISVAEILKSPVQKLNEQYDFVYASGLFDYLSPKLAMKLTEKMVGLTKSGGSVLVNNFLSGIPDRGYMEAFMDWFLIFRSPDEIDQFAKTVFPSLVKEKRYFEGENRNIGYLHLIKR